MAASRPPRAPSSGKDAALLQEIEGKHQQAQQLFALKKYGEAVTVWRDALMKARDIQNQQTKKAVQPVIVSSELSDHQPVLLRARNMNVAPDDLPARRSRLPFWVTHHTQYAGRVLYELIRLYARENCSLLTDCAWDQLRMHLRLPPWLHPTVMVGARY